MIGPSALTQAFTRGQIRSVDRQAGRQPGHREVSQAARGDVAGLAGRRGVLIGGGRSAVFRHLTAAP